MIKIEFKLDAKFIITTLQRYRRQHFLRNIWLIFKVIFIVLFLLLSLFSLFHKDYTLIVFFSSVIILILYGHRADYLLAKHRSRKSPFINEKIEITLNDEVYHVKSPKFETDALWTSFTKAVCFRDGLLLFQGPRLFNWLPARNITQGTAEELNQLVRSKIHHFKIVEQFSSQKRTGDGI